MQDLQYKARLVAMKVLTMIDDMKKDIPSHAHKSESTRAKIRVIIKRTMRSMGFAHKVSSAHTIESIVVDRNLTPVSKITLISKELTAGNLPQTQGDGKCGVHTEPLSRIARFLDGLPEITVKTTTGKLSKTDAQLALAQYLAVENIT